MTFEQFQATGRETRNIGEALRDDSLFAVRGRIYAGAFYVAKDDTGYWTLIGNCEHRSVDLATLERRLFNFAVDEAYVA